MGSTVSRIASAAWYGAFAVFLVLMASGMWGEARSVLGLMCLLLGVQFGSFAYDKLKGGEY